MRATPATDVASPLASTGVAWHERMVRFQERTSPLSEAKQTFRTMQNTQNSNAASGSMDRLVRPKKLWLVSVEFEMVVVAEDWRGAEREARKNAREEMSNDAATMIADEITDINQVPGPWRGSYPYGDETSKTVAELLGSNK